MSIRYIIHNEIDKERWDECVQRSSNTLLYGHSFYLNAMARHWDGLILNDYEAVMPLTWKTKWGISYLYQPAFIQQAGIFSAKPLTGSMTNAFLHEAIQRFKFAEITLNFSNKIEWPDDSVTIQQRNNYLLDLNRPYDVLYENYDDSFTKSLRRIRKFNMVYLESTNYQMIIELYRELYRKRLPNISKKSYQQFEVLCKKLMQDNKLIVRHARNSNNKLLASVVLLKDNNRFYNMISCVTSDGKRTEANYFLYDRILNEFANTPILFDFEGSDVEGIASFYQKFNPANQPYHFVRWNNLSRFAKFFKP